MCLQSANGSSGGDVVSQPANPTLGNIVISITQLLQTLFYLKGICDVRK